jgi:hypothetical protein
VSDERIYWRSTTAAPRPEQWDGVLRAHWPELTFVVLAIACVVHGIVTPGNGTVLVLGPLFGLAAIVVPRLARTRGTLVAFVEGGEEADAAPDGARGPAGAAAPTGPRTLELLPSAWMQRFAMAGLLVAGFAGPSYAVDALLAGTDASYPPIATTLVLFTVTLLALPGAWELGKGRVRTATMTLSAKTLTVDVLTTTRTVRWDRVRQLEPLPGAGARVSIRSASPIERTRRGSSGRGRVTQVEEAPQLTETFALGSYGGDPAILLAVLRAIAKDPTAAGRALAAEDPGQAVADLSAD